MVVLILRFLTPMQNVVSLPKEMEKSLKEYIHKLRLNGGICNKMILLSVAHGIVEYYNRSLLKKYGECLELSLCLGPITYV